MSATFSHGAPLSPDYGTDDQGDLIWVPVRVPKGLSCSPPAQSPNFYQTPDQLNMQDASASFVAPSSWEQDATMMSTMSLFPGISASEPTMDWSSSELSMDGGFDAALELEVQAYLSGIQIGIGETAEFMNHSTGIFPGSDGSGALYAVPELGFGLNVPDAFSVPQLGSPVESAWSPFDGSYSTPSGSCSPATNMSPATASANYAPQISDAPALFAPLNVSSHPQATVCPSTKSRQSRQRQRRASPTSPREGGSSNGNSFRCALCEKPHMDNRALSRHLWAQHPEYAARTKTKSERARCPHCDYSGRADNLARHMKRHAK